ncbi:MAG: PAS domain S-box protein [Alphaproteobacteria bacterium]|nr:PAS domain S-box protein [Alphaproteobacteria bacterium]
MREKEAVAESARRRLVEAIESLPQGLAIFGPDDCLVSFNERYRSHYSLVPDMRREGIAFEELARAAIDRGVIQPAPADPEAWLATELGVHREAKRRKLLRRANRWVQVEQTLTESGDIVVICTDVTAMRRRERDLKLSRIMLRGVIDAVPAIINVKNPKSRYVLMNRFQGEMFGVDPGDAIGRTSADFAGSLYGGDSREMDREVFRTGQALPWREREFVGPDGRRHDWFTAKLPLKDERGRVANVVSVALDITQLKATERARANLSRYVAPSLVDTLARQDEPFGPPRSQQVGVLFVDMVDFTRLATKQPALAIFELLRDFHARLARAVFAHAGTLDKFLGDGIMATFGTPLPGPNDASNTIACVHAILAEIEQANVERAAGGAPAVNVRIGAHWGEALMGTIGDAKRLEFAVIGDMVNVASRLLEVARDLDIPVAVSGALCEAARAEGTAVDGLVSRGSHALRGHPEKVTVWTPMPSTAAI